MTTNGDPLLAARPQLIEKVQQEGMYTERSGGEMPIETKQLTWATADLDDPAERTALVEQEMKRAGARAAAAFLRLKSLGIVDEKGNLISKDVPSDMRSGADRDFGG